MSARDLLDHRLVCTLYDCAESPEGLQPILKELSAIFGAQQAHAMVIESSGRLLQTHAHGHDDASFGAYEDHWISQDPRFLAASSAPGQVLSDVQVIDPKVFEGSAIYNDFLRRYGVRYTLFVNFQIAPNLLGGQSFMRSKRAGAFEPAHAQQLQRLLPHLGRALRLRETVQSLKGDLADLRRALDVVPGAMAILDGKGHLVCCNAAGERLLAVADGLILIRQRLTAQHSDDAQDLAARVKETAALAEGETGARSRSCAAPTTVGISRATGRPLSLMLMPLRPASGLRELGDRSARVLAVVHDPDAVLCLNPALISRLFGLTETEALMAAALAQGSSISQFSAARGCTDQTSRSHLKRIFQKTHTDRQADLVRVLLSSAALHTAGAGS